MAWFVYVKWNCKIEAQRFDEWPIQDGKPLEVLQSHKINPLEMHSRMKVLIRKYPYVGPTDLT